MAELDKVQVLVDGEPELTSTIQVFVKTYKVLVPGDENEYYASVTYEERNYEALSTELHGMLYCTDINLDEVPEEHARKVEDAIRKALALDGVQVDELEPV
jgi:hypothetical protein